MDLSKAQKNRQQRGRSVGVSPNPAISKYRQYRQAAEVFDIPAKPHKLDFLFQRYGQSENKRQEIRNIQPGSSYHQAKQYFKEANAADEAGLNYNRSNKDLEPMPLEYNASPDGKNPVSTIDAYDDSAFKKHGFDVQSTGSGRSKYSKIRR